MPDQHPEQMNMHCISFHAISLDEINVHIYPLLSAGEMFYPNVFVWQSVRHFLTSL